MVPVSTHRYSYLCEHLRFRGEERMAAMIPEGPCFLSSPPIWSRDGPGNLTVFNTHPSI